MRKPRGSAGLNSHLIGLWNKLKEGITFRKILLLMLGAMICTFGIHNIHQRTNITEGGVIGLMLLIEHWLNISPAYITPVLDIACYALAFKFLGTNFIKLSIISTIFISGFYKILGAVPSHALRFVILSIDSRNFGRDFCWCRSWNNCQTRWFKWWWWRTGTCDFPCTTLEAISFIFIYGCRCVSIVRNLYSSN